MGKTYHYLLPFITARLEHYELDAHIEQIQYLTAWDIIQSWCHHWLLCENTKLSCKVGNYSCTGISTIYAYFHVTLSPAEISMVAHLFPAWSNHGHADACSNEFKEPYVIFTQTIDLLQNLAFSNPCICSSQISSMCKWA